VEVLEDTIRSVINQDFEQIEYIVIDGNSTDGTLKILEYYKDKINIVISEPDKGIYDAMNKGLERASGKYVNFLNAGDSFISSKTLFYISQQIGINDLGVISGDFIIVSKLDCKRLIRTKKLTIKNLQKDFYSCHQTIFMNRKIACKYDISYQIKADYKWVVDSLKSISESRIKHINKPLVYYQFEGFSNQNFIRNLFELIRLQKELFGTKQVIKNINVYSIRILRSLKHFIKL